MDQMRRGEGDSSRSAQEGRGKVKDGVLVDGKEHLKRIKSRYQKLEKN